MFYDETAFPGISVMFGYLFCDPFQPLDHSQHGKHGDEAGNHENHPGSRHGEGGIKDGADEEQAVPYGSGTQPGSLHDTLVFWRGHLRDERDTQRADEKLSYGKDKIGAD